MRVYERSVSPVLYVEWHYLGERHQRSLKTHTGHPVTDRKLAKRIAEEMAQRLKQDHNRAASRAVFGETGTRTLGELLARLHAGRTWKDAKGPERFRRFWLDALGEDTPLSEVTPAVVEAVRGEWTPATLRHYRSYIVGAFYFAETKLKWIDARGNLSAVDMPRRTGRGNAYTLDEVKKLLPALEAEDVRAGWIGHVAWQTGRRLTAVRTLPKAAVRFEGDLGVLHFPAETDKAGRASEAVIVGRALELTRELMQTPGDYVCGEQPPSKELAIKGWMARAEKAAGIEHLPGRGWHALKRRFATETRGMIGRDKQAGTREITLEDKYVQDDRAPKIGVAHNLADLVKGPER